MRQLEDCRYLAESGNRQGALWERLKYIPFGRSPDAPFLTFGGEVRLRYELIDNTDFGSGPQDSGGYLLTRYMPYVALALPNLPAGWELQLFAQFEAAFDNYDDRGPGPIDQDGFDVLQALAKVSAPLGTGALSIQGGRQEISFGTERPGDTSNARFIGTQLEFVAEWTPVREWAFLVSYSQFVPGTFIRDTGPSETIHFFAVEAVFQF